MSEGPEAARVLVLRAWAERPGDLRVRITTGSARPGARQEVQVVAGAEPALAVVRAFLDELARAAG